MSPVKKRDREDESSAQQSDDAFDNFSENRASPTAGTGLGPGGTSSNFRNVSACNRCRHRKNRCDQRLPKCSACVKAKAECVGFDPVSKREIPRSYVYFLETRLMRLESLLTEHGIAVPEPHESFSISEAIKPGVNVPFPPLEDDGKGSAGSFEHEGKARRANAAIDPALQRYDERNARGKKASRDVAALDLRKSLPQTTMQPPGISFSKVVFAAVRSSVSQAASEKGGIRPSKATAEHGHTGHDCFFGLYIRPTYKPAPLPELELASKLVDLYFEHANPQIPILHRGEFMAMFTKVFAKPEAERTARELYLIKIVLAVGSGIIMDGTNVGRKNSEEGRDNASKRQRLAEQQSQPEEYHASAVMHLEHFLSSPPAMEGHGGGVEELQAVLLLAALALLRPVAPGLWYIIGVAVRLAVDLGLHFEDADAALDRPDSKNADEGISIGKRQWKRDLRRRLWWCVYSFDRLVSTCVGRPFGITDQVVTTEFPTRLDDVYITRDGFTADVDTIEGPTYKLVSHHYFRLRLLQSEILQVLQYRQAQRARAMGANAGNVFMHTRLPSPFLDRFSSFREWRADVDRRLGEWKDSAPTRADTGVSFNPLFLDLNYWQAIIMLYRQSLAVPAPLAEELSASTGENVQSPGAIHQELEQDEQQVFLKVAQAGQMVIKTYRQLHRLKLVNYTFLATHHLFMSGISFLYALWNSPIVRLQLTIDDVDFVVLAATSVLSDLMDKCAPAEACRDAFQRMSRATVSMCMSTTGFGSTSMLGSMPVETPGGSINDVVPAHTGYFSPQSTSSSATLQPRAPDKRTLFDMDMKELFSNSELTHRPSFASASAFGNSSNSIDTLAQQPIQTDTSAQQFYPAINTAQPDISFDNVDFLESFVIGNPAQQSWGTGFELDLGFGTGGTAGAYDTNVWEDGNGAQNTSGGVDLFDGFFFGGGAG